MKRIPAAHEIAVKCKGENLALSTLIEWLISLWYLHVRFYRMVILSGFSFSYTAPSLVSTNTKTRYKQNIYEIK